MVILFSLDFLLDWEAWDASSKKTCWVGSRAAGFDGFECPIFGIPPILYNTEGVVMFETSEISSLGAMRTASVGGLIPLEGESNA